jgi:hypothetical protein
MSQLKTKYTLYLLIFLLVAVFQYCQVEKGIEPIRSAIKGTIIFTGEWPLPPVEVVLIAADDYPPAEFSDMILG